MTARNTRRGFTLVEMLVVIAILGVLASLVLAAVTKVRIVQQNKTSEDTVRKLESSFARERTAVLNTASLTPSLPSAVLVLADTDVDRARVIWAYLKYKRAFPESFAEATSLMPIYDLAGNPVFLPEFSAPAIYSSLPVVSGTIPTGYSAADVADLEAAACAYLFMTKRAERGEAASMDEGMGSQFKEIEFNVTTGPAPKQGLYKLKVFKDTFNNVITFRRFFTTSNNELNLPPYVKQGLTYFDPFDPQGRLQKYDVTKPVALAARDQAHRSIFGTTGLFANTNFTGTFWSPGLNGKLNDADDILGYRVRQGN